MFKNGYISSEHLIRYHATNLGWYLLPDIADTQQGEGGPMGGGGLLRSASYRENLIRRKLFVDGPLTNYNFHEYGR